jgi:MFS family permease
VSISADRFEVKWRRLTLLGPPEDRGTAIAGYAFAVVGGPTCGPIVGGAIVQSYLGWRWIEYVSFSKISVSNKLC